MLLSHCNMINHLLAGPSSCRSLRWFSSSSSGNEVNNYSAGLLEKLRYSICWYVNNKWLLFKFLLFFILRPPFPCCWVMDFLKYGSVQRYFCSVTLNIKNSLVSIIIAWSIYFLIPVSLKSPPPLPSSPVMLAVPAAGGRRSWIWCTPSPSIFLASLPPLLGREGGEKEGDVVLVQLQAGGQSTFFAAHDTHSLV